MKFGLTFISTILLSAVAVALTHEEYPPPQFERADWVNLNREWSFALDLSDSGRHRNYYASRGFDGKITVPFAPESDLSGVGYKDFINRDLLLAGTILHDIGKIKEFDLSQLGLVSQYSVQGQLMGHLVIGAQEVALAAKECGVPEGKSMLLQHLLLSHHGEPDFGAAIRPVCAEAFLLHSIDAMDARMETYREQLDKMETGEVSNVIPVLGTRVYKHI